MKSNTMLNPGRQGKETIRVFVLYADFAAGICAKRLFGRMAARAGEAWHLSLDMWKLDSVSPVGPIREIIAQEAGESDILAVAISAAEPVDTAVVRWLEALVNWKVNRLVPGLLIGLVGDEERVVSESNWLVEGLDGFARRTAMPFAWHRMDRDGLEDLSWLTAGLDRLLACKVAARTPVALGSARIVAAT